MANSLQIKEGHPFPLGAAWDGRGTNFAIFSAHATKVELCLFDKGGSRETHRIELPEFTDEVWHVYIPDIGPGTRYGYRVHGPYAPEEGHRFNPHKLLMDPYARAYAGCVTWDHACFGYTIGDAQDDLSFDVRDSAPFVPKSVVTDRSFTWPVTSPMRPVPWDMTIIYELHVRGYTKRHPGIPERLRGTYGGLADKEIIDYIKSLGVTSVELMPVHSFIHDRHLSERGLANYWGYNSIGFFTPEQTYAADTAHSQREFKEMVSCFHDAGLEVILDVVYNHTAEGNEHGPTLSFRGIDNASYYRLNHDQKRYYINDTGAGNTLNLTHPRVIQMVADSLRFWVSEMHVDGFRFDLGTILAREPNGFDNRSGFLKVCCQDPVLSRVKLIAEPWDCGPGGYQVGEFPPGWGEWNDRFRDTTRRFWRGDPVTGDFSARLAASGDLFNHGGRKPSASVNFVTAHDGFTLNDVVSYAEKHNQANGEKNENGADENWSCNYGAEGITNDPDILSLRRRHMRNLLATLLLSQGTPMLLGGDEFCRTQSGNNNAYCQDNDISWVDWRLKEKNDDMIAFVRLLTQFRKKFPILRHKRFLTGKRNEDLGIRDVNWFSPEGNEMEQQDWESDDTRCFSMLIDGRSQVSGIKRRGREKTLLLVFNAEKNDVSFRMPQWNGGGHWELLLDTSYQESEHKIVHADDFFNIGPQSLQLFLLPYEEKKES